MSITSNPLVPALQAGQLQIGTWINQSRNPAILTLLKSAGLDYVRFEMEHSTPSIETVADMAVLSRALGLPLLVRPPVGNREWITRLLDAGCWGLQIPQVDNGRIAREVVAASRYAPLGLRGMGGLGPQIDFEPADDLAAQLSYLNTQVHITVMFESGEAFRNIDDIVSTPGIDAITIGPTDLAQDLGILGKPGWRETVDEHRLQLVDAARRHGKQVAFTVQSVEEGHRWIQAGVKLIAYASDAFVLRRGFESVTQAFRAGQAA